MAEEVLVPPSPDCVRDSNLALTLMRSLTTPAGQRRALPHCPGDSPVEVTEAEPHALQGKGFSDAAIAMNLAATHDSS